MACLDVQSVNEKICCIQNLEEAALEKEAAAIAKDLKTYIQNNFMLDVFQQKLLDRTSADDFKEYGSIISNAFLNRNYITAEPSERAVKCPKIKITLSVEIG
ncbi:MAG TPA: hypothetical protein VKG26_09940 [Bacteroidia bacterium]|nr:hypothetical protein [Bacteroidia bacterium]